MKTLLIINIFIAFLFASNSQNVGNSFRYGSNAREIALGNSISSNYNIGFNSFNNPSLLSDLKNNEYGFSFFPMSLDRYIQTFSMSFPIPPSAGIGISFFKSGVKDIPETNTSGTPIGNYDSWEGYGMLSFGAKFNKNML